MSTEKFHVWALGGVLVASIGCAHAGPSEALVEARQMKARAEQSTAPELAPEQMREADLVLARAEVESDRSVEETHFAYVASAKYEIAMAEARRRDAKHREEVAANRLFTEQAKLRRHSRAQMAELKQSYDQVRSLLDSTQNELDAVRRRLATEQNLGKAQSDALEAQAKTLAEQVEELKGKRIELESALAERDARLEAEHDLRIDAEKRAQSLIDKLSEVASVSKSDQGTVITLTGSVLFASGQSQLLPEARDRLKMVADALKAQDEHVDIVVAGYTDSQGNQADNEALSLARAQAVRNYLVDQGVVDLRIHAVGRGESEPVATNKTPEGRANNRRVEIILQGRG